MSEHPELSKGRPRLFIPVKDNNAGKVLSTATISRWICATIVDTHATLEKSKNLTKTVKAHKVSAVATWLQLFNKVDLQSVMKAVRCSSGGTLNNSYTALTTCQPILKTNFCKNNLIIYIQPLPPVSLFCL